LRTPALGLFDGRREASEERQRVDGQIGLRRARPWIDLRMRPRGAMAGGFPPFRAGQV